MDNNELRDRVHRSIGNTLEIIRQGDCVSDFYQYVQGKIGFAWELGLITDAEWRKWRAEVSAAEKLAIKHIYE